MAYIVNICLSGCLTSLFCVTPLNYSRVSHLDNDSVMSFVYQHYISASGVGVYSCAATVPPEEESVVLLSLPRPAADPETVGPEEALPGSHRLAGGTHHRHG